MGFIGTFLKTIFSPSVPQVSTPTVTARDLVSETSSQELEAPVMGSDSRNKRKNNGVSSLLVPSEDLYKGSV